MSNKAIIVNNISKKYNIGSSAHNTLRGSVSNLFNRSPKEDFWALKNISFEVEKGEAVGIVGNNGAGKSTLLKILSKITHPSTGSIILEGRSASLLEVGTGFHPELTGRENIFLNGSLLGMTRAEIRSKFDEIVDFSGIEKFIDTPVKQYSSGMYTRLAFSVAAHLKTEILLVDEVLAVGDINFQKKCLGKMGSIASAGKTVILVSHNHTYLESLCNKFIRLDAGEIVAEGNTLSSIEKEIVSTHEAFQSLKNVVTKLEIYPADNGTSIRSGSDLIFDIYNSPFESLDSQILRLEILDSLGGVKLILNNRLLDHKIDFRNGRKTSIIVKSLPLHPGVYNVKLLLKDSLRHVDYNIKPFYFAVNPSRYVKPTNAKSQIFGTYTYITD